MITRIWKEIQALYHNKQGTLYSSTVVVALTLLLARLLGVAKLRVLTSYYGAKELDLFFAAFRIPDFIFEVLIAGSIASCFIPIISNLVGNPHYKKEVLVFAQSLMTIFLAAWFVLLLVSMPFYRPLTNFLLPGYSGAEIDLVSSMSLSILLFQVPFLLVGNILIAILQTEKQFFIPGLAPVFYNAGIMVGVVLWAQTAGLKAAVYGVGLGALLYFAVLAPGIFILGYPLTVRIDIRQARIMKFFRLFVPRVLSSFTAQIDATVDLFLATLTGVGGYSAFYLARNIQILPVSFFGLAISQTALPFFARLYTQGKKGELIALFTRLVRQIFFIMTPMMVFLTVLRIPIVRLLFGGNKFDWNATVQTANVLSIFALSLPFHTIYYVITRVFFALEDTRTPFVTSMIFTGLNVVLSILFVAVGKLPIFYLALSFGIAITLNTSVLFYLLKQRLDHFSLTALLIGIGAILFIGSGTAGVVFVLKNFLDGLIFDTTRTINLFALTMLCIGGGTATYLYLAWIFVPQELGEFITLITRLSIIKRTISQYKKIFYTEKIKSSIEESV